MFDVLFAVCRNYNTISQQPSAYVQRKAVPLEAPDFGGTKQALWLEMFEREASC
jgi:hypothetical protein